MEKFSLAKKEALQSAQLEIEEVRAGMNADLTEHLADNERHDEGHFGKQRRSYEKKWPMTFMNDESNVILISLGTMAVTMSDHVAVPVPYRSEQCGRLVPHLW
jgi:hypothetical protein